MVKKDEMILEETSPFRRLRGKNNNMIHNYNDIQIIIMTGGVGSRFWPMSTPDYPKQFIDVKGVGSSLIHLTVDRSQSALSKTCG